MNYFDPLFFLEYWKSGLSSGIEGQRTFGSRETEPLRPKKSILDIADEIIKTRSPVTFQERAERLPESLTEIFANACGSCSEKGYCIKNPLYTVQCPDKFGNTMLLFDKNLAQTHTAVAVRFFLKEIVLMLKKESQYLGIHNVAYEECNPKFNLPSVSFKFTDRTNFSECDTIEK